MESSETQEKVIDLGKLLVNQFDDQRHKDVLSIWLAHYIANLLEKIEKADNDDPEKLKSHCFKVILKLWAHHSVFPHSQNPFEKFDKIFKTIEKLDTNQPSVFARFIGMRNSEIEEDIDIEQEDVQMWLNIALNVDLIAKTMIEYSIKNAVAMAADDKTKEWLKNASDLPFSDDARAILRIMYPDGEKKNAIQERKEQQAHLEADLEKIRKFSWLCSTLENQIALDIKKLREHKINPA